MLLVDFLVSSSTFPIDFLKFDDPLRFFNRTSPTLWIKIYEIKQFAETFKLLLFKNEFEIFKVTYQYKKLSESI
mgnify:CR=1 FL=1